MLALPVMPERPAIDRILLLVAYTGYTVEADAVLYGAVNHVLWGDDDLHAAVLVVHHGPKRRTRLMAAAREGDVPRLTRLLRMASGALRGRTNVNGADSEGWTALHWAARQSNVAALETLLAAGAAVEAATTRGETPLNLASQYGETATIEALLAAGAAVEAAMNGGYTPLHWAAQDGQTAALEALLAAGAAVGAETNEGFTPLDVATNRGGPAAFARALLAALNG
jgi:ankyrin repeat protein